jgi:hypothetical protein
MPGTIVCSLRQQRCSLSQPAGASARPCTNITNIPQETPMTLHALPLYALPGTRPGWAGRYAAGLALALVLGAHPAGMALADASKPADGFSAGLEVRKLANVAEIGLPVYPGAVPRKDADDEGGASLGLWGGIFGIRLQVVKLQSADGADVVAAWYRHALSGMGRLVDCSAGAPPPAPATQTPQKLLGCGSDRPPPGSALFKVGLPNHVRIVNIEPMGSGSRLQLVRLQVRGD